MAGNSRSLFILEKPTVFEFSYFFLLYLFLLFPELTPFSPNLDLSIGFSFIFLKYLLPNSSWEAVIVRDRNLVILALYSLLFWLALNTPDNSKNETFIKGAFILFLYFQVYRMVAWFILKREPVWIKQVHIGDRIKNKRADHTDFTITIFYVVFLIICAVIYYNADRWLN